MSLDAQKLVMLIKQAAVEAVNAKDPMSLKIGEVVSISPLRISINQKITIPASQLLLTNAVRDYAVYGEVQTSTDDISENETQTGDENAEDVTPGGAPANTEQKKIVIHSGLKEDEKVLMLRCDGGQKFIVLDRLEAPNG